MKNYLIFALLFLTCAQHTTFTMEHQGYQKIDGQQFDDYCDTEDAQEIELKPINQPTQISPNQTPKILSLDEAITIIDKIINDKYSETNFWGTRYQLDSSKLKEKDFFDIVHIIHGSLTGYDTKATYIFLEKFYKNNNYYQQTHQYFRLLGKKNIDKVTGDILETIINPNKVQPTDQLNKLPPNIKQYFMYFAYQHTIKNSYDIVLTGHKDIIDHFDIHTTTHRAATSSYDNTLRLWDLTTGKCIHIFPGDNNIVHCMKFNSDGSRLATATNYRNNSSMIRIWDTQSAQVICGKLVAAHNINSLAYQNKILVAHDEIDFTLKITIFVIDENRIIVGESTELSGYQKLTENNYRVWGSYTETEPAVKRSSYITTPNTVFKDTLTVTKHNCPDLYIYEQAIKNNPLKMNADKINKSKLTDYEKDRLHKLLIDEQTARKLTQK